MYCQYLENGAMCGQPANASVDIGHATNIGGVIVECSYRILSCTLHIYALETVQHAYNENLQGLYANQRGGGWRHQVPFWLCCIGWGHFITLMIRMVVAVIF